LKKGVHVFEIAISREKQKVIKMCEGKQKKKNLAVYGPHLCGIEKRIRHWLLPCNAQKGGKGIEPRFLPAPP
jgi:hypothetical protein